MQTLNVVADAALELNLDEWQIRRAIAWDILPAETVGGGEYRITDDAIRVAMHSSDLGWSSAVSRLAGRPIGAISRGKILQWHKDDSSGETPCRCAGT